MIRYTGTRHQSIITYCPKYRIEDIVLYDIDKRNKKQ